MRKYPKIDLENLKSLVDDYIQGFDGNSDFLVRTMPDLIELLDRAKKFIDDYGHTMYEKPDCFGCDWLDNFETPGDPGDLKVVIPEPVTGQQVADALEFITECKNRIKQGEK